jgi:hypothetical protein
MEMAGLNKKISPAGGIDGSFFTPFDQLMTRQIQEKVLFKAVFRIRIRIHRIHIFLGLPDPDLFFRGLDPDPSISKKKKKEKL